MPFRRRSVQLQTVNITTRKHMINRIRLRAMILVFPAVLLAWSNPSSIKAEDVFQQNNRLGRGVNLLGWDAKYNMRQMLEMTMDYYVKKAQAT